MVVRKKFWLCRLGLVCFEEAVNLVVRLRGLCLEFHLRCVFCGLGV